MSKVITCISDFGQIILEAVLVFLAALCLHVALVAAGLDLVICFVFIFALVGAVLILSATDNYVVRHYKGTSKQYFTEHVLLKPSSKPFYLAMLVVFCTLAILAYRTMWLTSVASRDELYSIIDDWITGNRDTAYIILRCLPGYVQHVLNAIYQHPEMSIEEVNMLAATCNANVRFAYCLWLLCAIPLHISKLFVRYLGLKKREERSNAGINVQNGPA